MKYATWTLHIAPVEYPGYRILRKKLIISRLAKKFYVYCVTRRFLTQPQLILIHTFRPNLFDTYQYHRPGYGLISHIISSGFLRKMLNAYYMTHPFRSPLLYHPSNIWWRVQMMKGLSTYYRLSSASCSETSSTNHNAGSLRLDTGLQSGFRETGINIL
jgi:hypothetical protein